MAGYLLRKSSITDCDQCKDQLLYDEPPDNDIYTFLRAKALQDKGTLFYPTESLIPSVESWATIFNGIFETIVHEKHVLSTLVSNSHHLLVDYLLCTDPKCSQTLNGMLHSYMKIRIHGSLKRSNKANTVSGLKRNRKVLKAEAPINFVMGHVAAGSTYWDCYPGTLSLRQVTEIHLVFKWIVVILQEWEGSRVTTSAVTIRQHVSLYWFQMFP